MRIQTLRGMIDSFLWTRVVNIRKVNTATLLLGSSGYEQWGNYVQVVGKIPIQDLGRYRTVLCIIFALFRTYEVARRCARS